MPKGLVALCCEEVSFWSVELDVGLREIGESEYLVMTGEAELCSSLLVKGVEIFDGLCED